MLDARYSPWCTVTLNQPNDQPCSDASACHFAAVALNVPLRGVFHYRIPGPLMGGVAAGRRVRVPFGRRVMVGYCVGLTDTPEVAKCKDIIQVLDSEPILDERMLRLTEWMADYYCCGWGKTLEAVLPSVVRKQTKARTVTFVRPRISPEEMKDQAERLAKRAPMQSRALWALSQADGEISLPKLADMSGAGSGVLPGLVKKGFVTTRKVDYKGDPFAGIGREGAKPPELTAEQAHALSEITERLKQGKFHVVLLHGVTGSGKTEVYLQALRTVVNQGRQGIVLVPEISLTPQTVRRFRARFDRVTVLHSKLTDAETRAQWQRIHAGQADVVIGSRSAVLAPVRSLGLLVVDEEHEMSFKAQSVPRYHPRDVGVWRARQENALVILGSATPSLESLHNADVGKYTRIDLKRRVDDRPLPRVDIVSMGEEFAERKRFTIISRRLRNLMEQSLARGDQVILFLNRRGFATNVNCKDCGFVLRCPQCDVAMTYHRQSGIVRCHYCNARARPPTECPVCASTAIRHFGVGTERIEATVAKLFPECPVARMDSDSMQGRHKYRDTLNAFRDGQVKILLGTQMIAKGLDFPNVTVVGVLNADVTLNLPDFRAAERTFQLLTQVAGRTGRGPKGGRVIVQTFSPEHSCIQQAARHDYPGFARKELEHRRMLGYPPFKRMARIVAEAKKEDKAEVKCEEMARALRAAALEHGVQILGPAPAPIERLKGKRRWHLLVKADGPAPLHAVLREAAHALKSASGVQVTVDVDPVAML